MNQTHSQKATLFSAKQAYWRIAFRPFFSLGALFAALAMLLWILSLNSYINLQLSSLWHAHEMIMGFGTAILAGFLLTAIQNWAGKRSLHGRPLQWLVGVWLLGRIVCVLPWTLSAAIVDLAFLPLLLYFLHPYLAQENQKRNQIFYVFLGLLLCSNLMYHTQMLGWTENTARSGHYLALHLYLLMVMLIGGRIIPAFTRSALEQARVQVWPFLEKLVFVSSAIWLICETFLPQWAWLAALVCAVFHLIRWLGWQPWQSWHKPILLVLPLGYAWLIIALFLRGLWAYNTAVTHLFTLGVMGGLMHAMMTRVSLGHTGRKIQTTHLSFAGYFLLQLALFFRIVWPHFWPQGTLTAFTLAGLCWCLVFLLYLIEYLPLLMQDRPDGRLDS